MRFLILLLAFGIGGWARAEPLSEVDMKAGYLYNFALDIEWPQLNRANFNFCTLGDEELGLALTRFDAKRLHGQRIVIARLNSLVAIRQCQVLYVPARSAGSLRRIQAELGDLPVLTVSEAPHLAQVGIVMALDGNRLVFDVNLDQLQQIGLKPSSALLRLARQVKRAN